MDWQGLRVSHGHQHVVEDVHVMLKCYNKDPLEWHACIVASSSRIEEIN